jgi:hypothetical protein
LKVKSRITEILLLRKSEAIIISNNFPNIWSSIHNKSYHNLLSLKKLAFKTLNQYYNSHFYHRDSNEHNFGLNLENSSNGISFLEKSSFINKIINNERLNLIKPTKNSNISHKEKIKDIKATKIFFNNQLFKGKECRRKESAKTITNKNGVKNESIISSNISIFNITDSIIKPSINFIPKDIDRIKNNINDNTISNHLKYSKKNTYEKSQEINNETNEKNFNSDINLIQTKNRLNSDVGVQNINNTSIEYYQEIIKSINDSRKENDNNGTLVNQKTLKFDKSSNNVINFSNEEGVDKIKNKIFTLKDVDENFSKKIRKKIKRRQKIERLRYSFEYQRKENNKNLVSLYSNIIAQKLNPILRDTHIYHISPTLNNIAEELINATFSKCNTQSFTEMLDSSSSEEIIQKKFDKNSLKPSLSESFEIKSSYKNINILSKGEIIRNTNYKKILENLIKKNSKNNIFNNRKFKSILSEKSKKSKNRETNNNKCSTKNHLNSNKHSSNKNISIIHNDKIQSISSKNINNYFNSKNIKNNKLTKTFNEDESKKKNINNNGLHKDSKRDNKNNLDIPNSNINITINNSTINNNKSYMSSLNFFNEFDKDNISKSENKLKMLNKNYEVNNSSINNNSYIHKDDIAKNKCIIA